MLSKAETCSWSFCLEKRLFPNLILKNELDFVRLVSENKQGV